MPPYQKVVSADASGLEGSRVGKSLLSKARKAEAAEGLARQNPVDIRRIEIIEPFSKVGLRRDFEKLIGCRFLNIPWPPLRCFSEIQLSTSALSMLLQGCCSFSS